MEIVLQQIINWFRDKVWVRVRIAGRVVVVGGGKGGILQGGNVPSTRIYTACEKSSYRSSLTFLEAPFHGIYTFTFKTYAMVVVWGALCTFLKEGWNLMWNEIYVSNKTHFFLFQPRNKSPWFLKLVFPYQMTLID